MPNINAMIKARQAILAGAGAPPEALTVVLPGPAPAVVDAAAMTSLYVTESHYAWKRRPSREQAVTDRAVEFAVMCIKGEDYVPREPGERRFTASRIGGDCDREVMFGYANAPKAPFAVKSQDRMDQGSMLHLAWQIEGLSAGWLVDAEQWRFHVAAQLGVKYDGKLGDAMGLLELKFTNSRQYSKVVRGDRDAERPPGPTDRHRLQVETALWLFDEQWASIVYINTDDADFVEYRVQRSPKWQAVIDGHMDRYFGYIERDTLPDMHKDCTAQTSRRYLGCQYRDICPGAGTELNLLDGLRR